MIDTELIPRKVLFGNPERTAPVISPDAAKLAFTAPLNGVMNVWISTVANRDERAVTSDKVRPIRSFLWQYDSKNILYLQDTGGDENYHLLQTNIESGETKDLTPYDNVMVNNIELSELVPNQGVIIMNRSDPRFFEPWKIDLSTGETTLLKSNPGDIIDWSIDNELNICAATRTLPNGASEILAPDGEGWKTLFSQTWEEEFGGCIGTTPEKDALWVLSSRDANATRLVRVPLNGSDPVPVAEDPEYSVTTVLLRPGTNALEAYQVTRARSEWVVIDSSIAEDFEFLKSVMDGDFTVVSRDLSDKYWTVSYKSDTAPTSYFLYQRDTKSAALLFVNQPQLTKYTLSPMKPITFVARDGMLIHGYLTVPAGVEQSMLPTVMLVHGGPWARDVWGLSPMVQWLANRGYAVIQVNYRGSTGYGKSYLNAGNLEWAGKMHTDLLDAKDHCVKSGLSDPDRFAIMGGSYGGYATLVALTFTPEEFTCGVDLVGPSSIETLLATVPPYWAPMLAMFKLRVGEDPELLRSRSPLTFASNICRPLLIAQGANDPRVKQSESDQIASSARALGKQVEYLIFPDEGHGFARPENMLVFAAATEAFLAQYLGGCVEPATPEEDASPFRH